MCLFLEDLRSSQISPCGLATALSKKQQQHPAFLISGWRKIEASASCTGVKGRHLSNLGFLYSSYQEIVNLLNFYTYYHKILNVFQGKHRSEKKKKQFYVNSKQTVSGHHWIYFCIASQRVRYSRTLSNPGDRSCPPLLSLALSGPFDLPQSSTSLSCFTINQHHGMRGISSLRKSFYKSIFKNTQFTRKTKSKR